MNLDHPVQRARSRELSMVQLVLLTVACGDSAASSSGGGSGSEGHGLPPFAAGGLGGSATSTTPSTTAGTGSSTGTASGIAPGSGGAPTSTGAALSGAGGGGGADGGSRGDGGDGGRGGAATTGDGASSADASSADASSADASATSSSADASAASSTADAAAASSTADASAASSTADTSSAVASSGSGGNPGLMSFFVTSVGNGTGNFGGLAGVDAYCQGLANAVGAGGRTWRAYVSTTSGDARARIGAGPWYDAAGVLVAADVASLHANGIVHERMLDENGAAVPNGITAPGMNEHDILTGSNPDGTFSGRSCADFTSASPDDSATMGHCDASFTENGTTSPVSPSDHWISTHDAQGCDAASLFDTGSSGRVYCFAP